MRKLFCTKLVASLAVACVGFACPDGAAARQQAGQGKPAAAQAESRKPSPAQGSAAPKGKDAGWQLKVSKGTPAMISLKAKDAPLAEIAAELSRKLNAPVFLSNVMRQQRVSQEFSDIPLEGAVRILSPQPYIDYEVSGDPASQPRPIGIYLHALNEEPPDPAAVVKGETESLLIQGHTEEGTEAYEKAKEKDDLPLRVKVEKDALSVRARRQPLSAVLAEIASKVDIPFEMKYESSDLVDVDFNSYTIDQAVRTLSPNIRLYMRTDLLSYENRPLRLVLVPPAGAQQPIRM
ncbi:MAG TPA: hypothetical protein VK421_11015 [Pyrinomonadaceae bacterium]|nr:hypothetical protein [Pyrinomonadaceae bacterium]